jgi:hypothetical protein
MSIYIHRVLYATPEGNEFEYRSATMTNLDKTAAAIRETADRQAAETDPALAFVSHDITEPGIEIPDEQEVTEQP